MFAQLTPIERCAEVAGLAPGEIMIGVTPGEKHERLLAKYRRSRRSPSLARARIVADIRAAMSLGEKGAAADLLVVLRRLLALGLDCGPRGIRPSAPRRRVRTARAPRQAARPVLARLAAGALMPACRRATVIPLPARTEKPVEPVV